MRRVDCVKQHPIKDTPLIFLAFATNPAIGEKEVRTMTRRSYGLLNFIIDVVLFILTSGLWLIWIFVREMRRR